jgi:hypothetical protein
MKRWLKRSAIAFFALFGLASLVAVCAKTSPRSEMAAEPYASRGVAMNAAPAAPPPSAEEQGYLGGNYDGKREEPKAKGRAADARHRPSPGGGGSAAKPTTEADDDADAKPEEQTPAQRMLHYYASAQLRVDSPRKTADEASRIAIESGGFVEQLATNAVVLRVPVAQFRAVLASLLKLGDVISKTISAHDVTDAFAAVELRLQTAKTSRDRLIVLLAKARTEREKLDLLREIQRLTQEIDELDNASKTLVSLANFSRIQLTLEERTRALNAQADEPVAAFQWIHALSAFRRDVAFEGKKLKLDVPQGFVQLDDKQHWIAESADAAVFWSSKRDNAPQGTTRFWADAVKARLEPEFASVKEEQAGAFTVLRFVDRSDSPYHYLVALRANGDALEVIEAHFPTAEQEKRYGAAVIASITKGAL